MNKAKKIKNINLKFKHSIRRQITFAFVAIMALTILSTWMINNAFLERVYENSKEEAILNVHDAIVNATITGDVSSDNFDLTLQKYSNNYNVSIIIISSLFEPIKIYANEPEDQLLKELQKNIRGTITAKKILKETDSYILIETTDDRMQTEYLEMWGNLPNGSFFLMRTALESIRISANIANRFLLYVGIGAIIVSAIFIYLITRQISSPVLKLADISERMSKMDFTVKYSGSSNNELSLLGNNINTMSDNLEKAIEELKEANIELQKDNELKTQIDEMRKEFISNVSHELKTPIALIQGYAEGLKEGINEAEERDYYCDVIMDEASKMNNMVKQLLALNQLESGFDILQKEEFDIVALVRSYVQSAEILTEQNGIKVSVKAPFECLVNADEFKIEEVFMNFFTNAINHCESDTEKRIDVDVTKVNDRVRVTVYNSGKNIPEESIDRLWEKFYKVDKARTRQYGGSGVGLSIVKAIMEAHGGSYGVLNVEGGVKFYFEL